MARASTVTLLSLSEFGQQMGIDPWHLNQIERVSGGCKDVYYQFAWQRDWLSRESLAQAIARAEYELALHLGFWPAPKYIVNEPVQYPRPARRTEYGAMGTPRGDWKAVQLKYKKILGGGTFARVAVSGNEPVTYTSTIAAGIEDGFTLTVAATDSNAVSITDPDEIAIYFNATDRIGAVEEQWRIRPVKVTISGGNATITGHKADLVLPRLQMDPTVPDQPIPDVAASYATQVDVYRVYRDTSATDDNPAQGTAIWEDVHCTADCDVQIEQLCIGNRNADMGQVAVQIPDCWPQNREPDRLLVNYVSGVPLFDGKMDTELAQKVAALACVFLPTEKCGCEWVDRIIAYWREIPPQDFTKAGSRQVPVDEILENPWSPCRGARNAWEYVKNHPLRFSPVLVM